MVLPFDVFKKIFRDRSTDISVPPRPRQPEVLNHDGIVRRHFFNEDGFQTYASFFQAWNGWITAGHVLDENRDRIPPFADGDVEKWPAGLDAALLGCALPTASPADPWPGQSVRCIGFPAGSAHYATRDAKIYLERPGNPNTWIAHILSPDEPVVTGMSGGAVQDMLTGQMIGIIITRNSPADLNADRDPDESFDFVSLAGVWRALKGGPAVA